MTRSHGKTISDNGSSSTHKRKLATDNRVYIAFRDVLRDTRDDRVTVCGRMTLFLRGGIGNGRCTT